MANPHNKATGPISAPRDPSQNARRHGLTAAVPTNDTLSFYRLIVDNPYRVAASYATHETDRLAYILAMTEARVERATAAERKYLFGRFAHSEIRLEGDPDPEALTDVVLSVEALKEIVMADSDEIEGLVAGAKGKTFWQEAKLLKRYRREAETARRRALRDYLRARKEDEHN